MRSLVCLEFGSNLGTHEESHVEETIWFSKRSSRQTCFQGEILSSPTLLDGLGPRNWMTPIIGTSLSVACVACVDRRPPPSHLRGHEKRTWFSTHTSSASSTASELGTNIGRPLAAVCRHKNTLLTGGVDGTQVLVIVLGETWCFVNKHGETWLFVRAVCSALLNCFIVKGSLVYKTSVLQTFKNGSYTTHHTPLINTPLIIHHSSYTTHHTPLIIHHLSYTTHHTPLINTPLINTPLIIHHSSSS